VVARVHRTDETSLAPLCESRALLIAARAQGCLHDSYRIVRRIRHDCAQTDELCRRQRKLVAEQREFLKSLSSDGGARVVE
jgi:hypothetical protein